MDNVKKKIMQRNALKAHRGRRCKEVREHRGVPGRDSDEEESVPGEARPAAALLNADHNHPGRGGPASGETEARREETDSWPEWATPAHRRLLQPSPTGRSFPDMGVYCFCSLKPVCFL